MEDPAKRAEQWIGKATAILGERYDRLRAASSYKLAPGLAIEPALDAREAEYLVRGIEGGVFSIDDQGYAQSVVLPEPSKGGAQKRMLPLFWRRADKRYLFREGVCQLATLSVLTLKHGWPLEQIRMEPSFPEFPHLAWAVDILLKDASEAIVSCCEVKRNEMEFNQLVTAFWHCCARGQHSRDECRFAKNHPKYEFCCAFKPAYFMATSPGREICFRLSYEGGIVAIEQESHCLIGPADITTG